jgi:hypothetical protein
VGTDDTGARYVAVDLAVLGVPGEQASTFGATNVYAVTVAVDDAEALAIAAAVDNGTVHLLRSTGAPDVATELLIPPETTEDDSRSGTGD